jgi:hypothetical protein
VQRILNPVLVIFLSQNVCNSVLYYIVGLHYIVD